MGDGIFLLIPILFPIVAGLVVFAVLQLLNLYLK